MLRWANRVSRTVLPQCSGGRLSSISSSTLAFSTTSLVLHRTTSKKPTGSGRRGGGSKNAPATSSSPSLTPSPPSTSRASAAQEGGSTRDLPAKKQGEEEVQALHVGVETLRPAGSASPSSRSAAKRRGASASTGRGNNFAGEKKVSRRKSKVTAKDAALEDAGVNAISGIADLLSTKKTREGERLHTSVSNRPPLPITVFPTVYYLEEAPLTSLRPSGGADDATQPQACTAASEPNRSANDEDNSAEARDARAKAERQSIAKLLIISQSVGAIFCPLPGRNSVEEYLKNLDAAKPASATALAAGRSSLRSRGEPHDRQAEAKEATFPLDLVAERVLVEQKADHQFCIHVRDMEQLVPPAHLLPIPPSSSSAPVNSKSTTTRAKKSADASKTAATPPPDPVPLDPVARLKAMHKWRFDALKQSQWSLARYAVPNNVHAITRLRLHEPAKVDVTVVQSCGAPKRPEDILAALNRFTKGQQEENKSPKAERGSGSGTMGKEEEEVMKAIFLAAFTQQSGPERHEAIQSIAAMGMLSPFVVKPLITVYASCLPRREALIGKPVGEQEFLEQGENNLVERWLNVVSRSVEELEHHLMMEDGGELKQQLAKAKAAMLSGKKSRVNSASHLSSAKESQVSNIQQLELLTAAATQNFSSRMEVGGEEGYYAHCYKRPIPTMPRHTTRLTLMAEHNDLEGSDLISLAERITTRKKQQQQERSGQSVAADAVQTSRLKTTPRIYCLIKDGDRL